jgi:hypothetical protein
MYGVVMGVLLESSEIVTIGNQGKSSMIHLHLGLGFRFSVMKNKIDLRKRIRELTGHWVRRQEGRQRAAGGKVERCNPTHPTPNAHTELM